MADSLILNGVKHVKNHTGTEMLLTRPKRGGDTHQLKEWWMGRGAKQYTACTVFDVTGTGGTAKLVVDSSSGTNLKIIHDGALGFTFGIFNEVKRAALFTSDFQLIEHYVFPQLSGGPVMTVVPADGAAKPTNVVSPEAPAPTPAKREGLRPADPQPPHSDKRSAKRPKRRTYSDSSFK